MSNPRIASTSSPTANPRTSLPIASITPAASVPRIGCRGRNTPIITSPSAPRPRGRSRERMRWSATLTPVARTRTRTSSGPGSGMATVATLTTSGPPNRRATAARVVLADAVDPVACRETVVMIAPLRCKYYAVRYRGRCRASRPLANVARYGEDGGGRMPGRRLAERSPLTQDRVLEAATAIADRDGIDALTMRRLADDLGVEAMSIYYHLPNKDAILDGLVERTFAEIETEVGGFGAQASDVSWAQSLRARILGARRVMLRHPWVPQVME